MLVRDILELYVETPEYARLEDKPTRTANFRRMIKATVGGKAIGDHDVNELTRKMVVRAVDKMVNDGRYMTGAIHNAVASTRLIWSSVQDRYDDLPERNPFEGRFELGAQVVRKKVDWTQDDFKKIRKSADALEMPWVWHGLALAYQTGQRIGDILGLRHDDVKAGVWHLRQSKCEYFVRLNLKDLDEAWAIVEHLREKNPQCPYVVADPGRPSGPITYATFRNHVRKVLLHAGLEDDLRIHGVRRARAMDLGAMGIPAVDLCGFFGWRSLAAAAPYLKPTEDAADRVIDVVKRLKSTL
jgi:integrase